MECHEPEKARIQAAQQAVQFSCWTAADAMKTGAWEARRRWGDGHRSSPVRAKDGAPSLYAGGVRGRAGKSDQPRDERDARQVSDPVGKAFLEDGYPTHEHNQNATDQSREEHPFEDVHTPNHQLKAHRRDRSGRPLHYKERTSIKDSTDAAYPAVKLRTIYTKV